MKKSLLSLHGHHLLGYHGDASEKHVRNKTPSLFVRHMSVTAVACAYISTPHAHTALCCRVPTHSHQASPWPRRPVCGRFIPHPEQTLSGLQRAARVSAHLLLHAGTRSIFSAGCPGRRRPVETPHSRRLQQQTEKITLDWV